MSAIQELAPYIEAYPRRVRAAKEEKHYTISDIIERSGVSASAVNKLLAGTQMEPKLYNSAALCKVLGLSLDELFGLSAPDHTGVADLGVDGDVAGQRRAESGA